MTNEIEVTAAQSEIMKEAFDFYCEQILHPLAPKKQRAENEMAFYAGAIQVFNMMMAEEISDDDLEELLDKTWAELMAFALKIESWASPKH